MAFWKAESFYAKFKKFQEKLFLIYIKNYKQDSKQKIRKFFIAKKLKEKVIFDVKEYLEVMSK